MVSKCHRDDELLEDNAENDIVRLASGKPVGHISEHYWFLPNSGKIAIYVWIVVMPPPSKFVPGSNHRYATKLGQPTL